MKLSPGTSLPRITFAIAVVLAGPTAGQAAEPFDLKRGDRIAIIGNTLADRMQHDGWLETYLHTPLPEARPRLPQPRLLRRRADAAAALRQLRHARTSG